MKIIGKKGGKTVVFIHGFGEDQRIWHPFTEAFTHAFQVITLNLPESDSIAEMAGKVNEELEAAGFDQFYLIGHSMGGYVSLALAEKHPEKLLGLGLFHSHPFADDEEKKVARTKSIEFVERQGLRGLFKAAYPKLFADANAPQIPQLLEWAMEFYPASRLIANLTAMRDRPDRSTVLPQLEVPVLFIIGGQDGAIPHEKSMAQTHLPDLAHIHLLEGVGHMGFYEAEAETRRMVGEFLGLT